ncbi:NAD(P)-binding domain-containing protein, partial [bacterium]|nr:NAD(P)-binding domain-containing protein [candidate division CSSED10-310 bacterium]
NDMGGAEGMISGADITLTEQFLSQARGLKYISLNCSGYDHIDLDAARANKIQVSNVQRMNYNAVADFTWGMILALMRRINEGDKSIRSGKWCDEVKMGIAVSEKKMGIIGLGSIGQAVARRAKGFDMTLISDSRKRDPKIAAKYDITYVSREDLLSSSDIIVLTCPLVEETRHMISHNEFKKMKSDAVLINPSRGGIIDTEALIWALQNGIIAGAALDVFETEPLYSSGLFDLPNVLLTPHMAGLADREISLVAQRAAVNMVDFLLGKKLNEQII